MDRRRDVLGVLGLLGVLTAAATGCQDPVRRGSRDHEDDEAAGGSDTTASTDAWTGSGGSGEPPSTGGSEAPPGTGGSEAPPNGPGCEGVFGGACGQCVEANCCAAVAACADSAGCIDCVAGDGAEGCQEAAAPAALLNCASSHCLDECFTDGGGGAGGSGSGYDLVNCTGPASTSGTLISDVTPAATLGTVTTDPSGNVKIILMPRADLVAGDIVVGIYVFVAPGQLSYPLGSVGCAVLEYTGSSWSVVETTQMCEVNLSRLEFASSADVCDGEIVGAFDGLFAGNQMLAGTFSLPLSVAESQIDPPSCQPMNGPCTQHADCCSASCSMYIGVCN